MMTPVLPRLLAGMRATDHARILVGAGVTRPLASIGAEIIRIAPADTARVALARYVAPFSHDIPCCPEDRFGRAADYCNNHAGKCGLRLNANPSAGQALLRRCVAIGRCGDGK